MKILSTMRAGRVVRLALYSPKEKSPTGRRRTAPTISREDKERANLRHSYEKLALRIFANFEPGDWWVTLTYRDEYRPPDRAASKPYWRKFIRQLRKARNANGETIKYIYCTQRTTSDGRLFLHHHMILRCEDVSDKELILNSWKWGDIKRCRHLRDMADLWSKAHYMCREPLELGVRVPGEQMWTPSRGLIQPQTTYTIIDSDNIDITVPVGCAELTAPTQLPDYGGYKSILYYEPL